MLTRRDFPTDFIFGAATSAYQIEGQSFGGAGVCHWDTFARRPGAISDGNDGAVACDHYHRFEADLDLLHGFDAYRFSTNWSRILPEGRGAPNDEGLDFYDRLVDAVLARGLAPFLTLYHWDLPEALSQLGGWTNRDVAGWFGDYADIVMDRIGDRTASVATLNEPWCVSYLSHCAGHHAPGLRDIAATARSMHNVLLAHAEGLERLRARGQENLGIVLNFEAVRPTSDGPADLQAARTYDAIINRWFIEALTKGTYPAEVLDGLAPHMPAGWERDMERIHSPIDWLGVNYYTRQWITAAPDTPWPALVTGSGAATELTQMGWEIYPEGLTGVLIRLRQEQGVSVPIYVTENGMAWDDRVENGEVNDAERCTYIAAHLEATRHAIDAGADIRGFFYWSLLDNYEWAFGYEKRFGLVHVDYTTQKRTPKQSHALLKKALERK